MVTFLAAAWGSGCGQRFSCQQLAIGTGVAVLSDRFKDGLDAIAGFELAVARLLHDALEQLATLDLRGVAQCMAVGNASRTGGRCACGHGR